MKEIVFEILNDMAEELSVMQLKKLQEVLLKRLQEQDEQVDLCKLYRAGEGHDFAKCIRDRKKCVQLCG